MRGARCGMRKRQAPTISKDEHRGGHSKEDGAVDVEAFYELLRSWGDHRRRDRTDEGERRDDDGCSPLLSEGPTTYTQPQ